VTPDPPALLAGDLVAWAAAFLEVLDHGGTMPVLCGSCTACCQASQFVEVDPDEHGTLARIPAALLVPSPSTPGRLVLGYDEHGRCPVLGDEGCTIYAHRPSACRRYDCRVFAATGVYPPADGPQAAVAARARRWQFGAPSAGSGTEDADALVAAVRARLRREAAAPY
jgi:hypothetical protein